ncbi:MAG TPA: hypothetical protein VEM93_09750 [Actinomycetota bacterium]|nr:hypothetical protein [Actinomycetota bacterium]
MRLSLGSDSRAVRYLASLLIERGEPDEAREVLDSTARWADSDDLQLQAGFAWVRARILRAEGRNEDALPSARDSIALGPGLSWLHTDVKEAFVQGLEAAAALADTSSLRELLEKIDGLWPGERSPILEAQASRFRGRLAWIEGDLDRVPTHMKPAAGAFREIGTPFWLAVTLLEHAEWLGSQQRLDEAEPLLAEAGEVFERLQAKPWLERLQQAPRPAVVG